MGTEVQSVLLSIVFLWLRDSLPHFLQSARPFFEALERENPPDVDQSDLPQETERTLRLCDATVERALKCRFCFLEKAFEQSLWQS